MLLGSALDGTGGVPHTEPVGLEFRPPGDEDPVLPLSWKGPSLCPGECVTEETVVYQLQQIENVIVKVFSPRLLSIRRDAVVRRESECYFPFFTFDIFPRCGFWLWYEFEGGDRLVWHVCLLWVSSAILVMKEILNFHNTKIDTEENTDRFQQ